MPIILLWPLRLKIILLLTFLTLLSCEATTNVYLINDTEDTIIIETIFEEKNIREIILPDKDFGFAFLRPVRKEDGQKNITKWIEENFGNDFKIKIIHLESTYTLLPDIAATLMINNAKYIKKRIGVFYLNLSEVINEIRTELRPVDQAAAQE